MPLVTYSALRMGLLAVCFAVGYWAGLRTWLLLLVAVFAAWALSYVLLAGPRDAAAAYVAQRVERRRQGARSPGAADDDAALEDALDDRARARGAAAGPQDDVLPQVAADPPGEPSHLGRANHPGATGYPGETARPSPNSTP